MKAICKELYRNSRFNNSEIIGLIIDSNNQSFFFRKRAVINSLCPIFILEKLSKDSNWEIRSCVAYNRNTSPHILKQLSKSKNLDIRIKVAHNPNTPIVTLIKLSKDKQLAVRFGVTMNPTYIKYIHKL